MGSKAKFAKDILRFVLKNRKPNQLYVEPFCGGCNMLDKVQGNRMASDNNKYLIALWKGLQQGRLYTSDISKDLFDKARIEFNNNTNINFDDFELGWIGFMSGFNGRFYGGGYSGIQDGRNYIIEQVNNTLKQIRKIDGVVFFDVSYNQLDIPNGSIIYCDPPYASTKDYSKDKFNHDAFWDWVRLKSKDNEVFVSEYNAPADFVCIWSKDVNVAIRPNKTVQSVEKLFVHQSKTILKDKVEVEQIKLF
jgi:DNA adenine methylase